MGPEHSITVSYEWLEGLQNLLVAGWFILFLWFAGTLMHESGMLSSKPVKRADKPGNKWDPDAYCPIGRRPQWECPHCRKLKE